jgi:hypothetical protein
MFSFCFSFFVFCLWLLLFVSGFCFWLFTSVFHFSFLYSVSSFCLSFLAFVFHFSHSIARNLSVAKQLFDYAILGFALTTIALLALMMVFLILFVL